MRYAGGEVLCILGPNGAGKSTTINILTAVLGSDEGDICFKGTKISKILRSYKQSIGIVPQDIALYEELSAEQNLKVFRISIRPLRQQAKGSCGRGSYVCRLKRPQNG